MGSRLYLDPKIFWARGEFVYFYIIGFWRRVFRLLIYGQNWQKLRSSMEINLSRVGFGVIKGLLLEEDLLLFLIPRVQ